MLIKYNTVCGWEFMQWMDNETAAIRDTQSEVIDWNIFQPIAKYQTTDKSNESMGNVVSNLHVILCGLLCTF